MPIEPHYFGSSTRIVQFMQSIGININVSPREHFTPARQLAQTMPCWPIEGSIQETDDFIVVKLSEDQYYQEDFQ